MKKTLHASLRIEQELYSSLQEEANDKYEGNLSLLIRQILKDYIKRNMKINLS